MGSSWFWFEFSYLQDTDEYDMYLDRLLDRVKHEKGVSFKEFRDFCQFLNNLEDFSIAMRMYTLSDQAISKGIFFTTLFQKRMFRIDQTPLGDW